LPFILQIVLPVFFFIFAHDHLFCAAFCFDRWVYSGTDGGKRKEVNSSKTNWLDPNYQNYSWLLGTLNWYYKYLWNIFKFIFSSILRFQYLRIFGILKVACISLYDPE